MSRYDKLRKLERNRALVEYQERHPTFSLEEIGKVFGITKQRVFQVLKAERKRRENI